MKIGRMWILAALGLGLVPTNGLQVRGQIIQDYEEGGYLGRCESCDGCDCGGAVGCDCAACAGDGGQLGAEDCSCFGGHCSGPYGDATCAPHWFDFYSEVMYLTREGVSRRVDFTSDGIGGPIVLSTADLDFDAEPGFRVTGTYQIGAASHLEGSYFGTFHWSTAASATSNNNNLYSVLSNFGTLPPGGFLQTDQASSHSIEYGSELHNAEMNWRHHWVAPSYWFHGSCLMGIRYVRLEEDFRHITLVNAHVDPLTLLPRGPASMNYLVTTSNDLLGFQLGAELGACVLPGITLGAEFKAGVYGNDAEQDTTVAATNLAPALREADSNRDVALVSEAGVMVVYQVKPWLSLRGGYQLLFLDGVALAPENFNTAAPFPPPREVFINDNGNVFYHGYTAGLEWTW